MRVFFAIMVIEREGLVVLSVFDQQQNRGRAFDRVCNGVVQFHGAELAAIDRDDPCRGSHTRFVCGRVEVNVDDVAAVPRDQRGEVQANRPTLRPCDHRDRFLPGQADAGRREDLPGAVRAERKVSRDKLHRITGGPQPGQLRLLGPAGGDQLRTAGDPGDDHAEYVVTGRRPEFVHVVEHQHER